MRTAAFLTVIVAATSAFARNVLVVPLEETGLPGLRTAVAACEASTFRGAYAQTYSVYEDCAPLKAHAHEVRDDEMLYHVQPAGVDAKLAPRAFLAELKDMVLARALPREQPQNGDQVVVDAQETMAHGWMRVLHATPFGALLAVQRDELRTLDAVLPPYLSLVALPDAAPSAQGQGTNVEEEYLGQVLDELVFSGSVAGVLGALSLKQMHSDITWLSGEDPASPIWTRHSFSDGAREAADWLQTRFEETGARCYQMPFLAGFAPNVVCEYEVSPSGNASAAPFVLGAHYDSRGSWGSTRAPGADDDGSGTTQLLAIARAIHAKKVRFHAPVRLVAFAGEEQGLLGSRAYAKKLRSTDSRVALMIQADMLAFHSPDEPMQLGLPASIHAAVASYLVGNVSALYSPELSVGTTAACCSDHQSFVEQGYPATQVFERAGPIIDPMYHNSGDLVNRTGYDLAQVHAIAKVTFATLLHAAGYDIA